MISKAVYAYSLLCRLPFVGGMAPCRSGSCTGDFADKCVYIRGSSVESTTQMTCENKSQVVKGKFSLKYLNLFTKGSTNMCSVVEIMLKNDYPILIKYAVASLGHITFCLAPKIDD